jgi:hypothetical protein
LCKSITDRVEDRIDDLLDVTLIQMGVLLGELDDQFGFDHIGRRSLAWHDFWKLPERQGGVKPVNPAAESQATYMGVNSLRLTALVFPTAQSMDL